MSEFIQNNVKLLIELQRITALNMTRIVLTDYMNSRHITATWNDDVTHQLIGIGLIREIPL